jgi:hypothetical protein
MNGGHMNFIRSACKYASGTERGNICKNKISEVETLGGYLHTFLKNFNKIICYLPAYAKRWHGSDRLQ